MLKKILFILSLFCLVLLAVSIYGYQQLTQFAKQPVTAKHDQFLVVEKGTSSQKLARILTEQGLVRDARWLPYWLKLRTDLSQFKAGVYSLNGITTLEELLQHLNHGKEVQLSLQFIEGRTFSVWLQLLENAPYLNKSLAGKNELEIAKLLNIPYDKLEGWFAPDTYSYVPYSTDLDLLRRAHQKMTIALNQAWENRVAGLPLNSPYEMLILASIVEKETGIASERPQVASVFINRLRLKMKLQTDPTVIYGMGARYQGNIRKKDLQEATPYNTYVIDGLPPTPIAMPSEASLKAVSQPDETAYLYFVADGTGGHKFSKTLAEHNQAVRQWIQIERGKKNGQ